jgi:hypothetical protein
MKNQRELTTNWQAANKQAHLLISEWLLKLDHRKNVFKDEHKNRRVLAAFLAFKEGPFEVVLSNSPPEDRDTLKEATEALLGDVLQRTKGRTGFKFSPKIILPVTKVQTISVSLRNTLTTRMGAIYRNETYKCRLVKDFHAIGQARICSVRITDPFANMILLSGQIEDAPRNWLELPDIELTAEGRKLWVEFEERLQEAAFREAITCLTVDEPGLFLTTQPDRLARLIRQTATRQFGGSRLSPSMILTNSHGKKSNVWGTCPTTTATTTTKKNKAAAV